MIQSPILFLFLYRFASQLRACPEAGEPNFRPPQFILFLLLGQRFLQKWLANQTELSIDLHASSSIPGY